MRIASAVGHYGLHRLEEYLQDMPGTGTLQAPQPAVLATGRDLITNVSQDARDLVSP
jgi:hypothetical protein